MEPKNDTKEGKICHVQNGPCGLCLTDSYKPDKRAESTPSKREEKRANINTISFFSCRK